VSMPAQYTKAVAAVEESQFIRDCAVRDEPRPAWKRSVLAVPCGAKSPNSRVVANWEVICVSRIVSGLRVTRA